LFGKICGGVGLKVIKIFIDRHISSEKVCVMYVMQNIRGWAVDVLLLGWRLNSVTTFFKT